MKVKNILKWLIGAAIATVFMWLSFRNVSWTEIMRHLEHITWFWILPYSFATLLAHYLRSVRWGLLIKQEGKPAHRFTLFTAVMFAYLMNMAVPRLGEVSRSVYVAKAEGLSVSSMIGTVVVERLLDILALFTFCFIVFSLLISDPLLIESILGYNPLSGQGLVMGVLMLTVLFILIIVAYRFRHSLRNLAKRFAQQNGWFGPIFNTIDSFLMGFLSVRTLKSWSQFIVLTLSMWVCYALMAYVPFFAFPDSALANLSFSDGIIVMAISAIGIVLPSPGGIGTYHFFVQQTLTILYGIENSIALSYAFVSHGAGVILVLLVSPLLLILNRTLFRPRTD